MELLSFSLCARCVCVCCIDQKMKRKFIVTMLRMDRNLGSDKINCTQHWVDSVFFAEQMENRLRVEHSSFCSWQHIFHFFRIRFGRKKNFCAFVHSVCRSVGKTSGLKWNGKKSCDKNDEKACHMYIHTVSISSHRHVADASACWLPTAFLLFSSWRCYVIRDNTFCIAI